MVQGAGSWTVVKTRGHKRASGAVTGGVSDKVRAIDRQGEPTGSMIDKKVSSETSVGINHAV